MKHSKYYYGQQHLSLGFAETEEHGRKVLKVGARPWYVRMVYQGESYGRQDCLEHEEEEATVEFFDGAGAGPDRPLGTFVSRYYVSTLLSRSDEGRPQLGIALDTGVPAWSLSAVDMGTVLDWLRGLDANVSRTEGGLGSHIRQAYFTHRREMPYLPAAYILASVKQDAERPKIPDWIPCTPWDHEQERDGLRYVFTVERDDCDLSDAGLGSFTDARDQVGAADLEDGLVDHLKRGGRGERGEYRWWRTDGLTAEMHAAWYHERGMAKGPAHNEGVTQLLEDYRLALSVADGQYGLYSFSVRVFSADGEEMGYAALGCICTAGGTPDYYRETWHNLVLEAEDEVLAWQADEAEETAAKKRAERAWELVERAAEGDDIQAEAAVLCAERMEAEGVSG